MVVGVLGEVVANPVVPEVRQEHAQILHQQMEVLSVLDLQVKIATLKHVLVMIFILHQNFLPEASDWQICLPLGFSLFGLFMSMKIIF